MDKPLAQSDKSWPTESPRGTGKQRQRVKQAAATRRKQLDLVEVELAEQIERLSRQAAPSPTQPSDAATVDTVIVERLTEPLEQLRNELRAWQQTVGSNDDRQSRDVHQQQRLLEQVERRQADLEQRQADLKQLEQRLQDDEHRLSQRDHECRASQQAFEQFSQQLKREREELAARQAELTERLARTASQRRQIARQMAADRGAHRRDRQQIESERQELARHRAELGNQQNELRAQRERLLVEQVKLQSDQQQLEQEALRRQALQAELVNERQSLSAEHEKLAEQVAQLEIQRTELNQLSAETQSQRQRIARELNRQRNAQRRDLERQRQELAEWAERQSQQFSAARSETDQSLAEERRKVEAEKRRLAELEASLENRTPLASAANPELERQLRDLEQRYKMALDDVRSERARAAELERKLAQGPARSSSGPSTGVGMDWESQKQALLQRLANDFDEDDDASAADRLEIAEVIRATDRIVAEKDRELSELRQLLEEQSNNWGSMAVGAAAVAEILDKDEMVRQERESLQTLQQEWRDKLRQAEIDISLERAKIARERAELEERLQSLPATPTKSAEESSSHGGGDKPKKTGGSRWLKHLGLKGGEDE